MRNRWLVGSLAVAVFGLAGMRAAGLALGHAKVSGAVGALRDEPKKGSSPVVNEPTPGDPPPTEPSSMASKPLDVPMPASDVRPAGPVLDDPMGSVDSFLRRSRQEADESIKALAQEAEALKARLQKVEAALGRWQAVADALGQDGERPWRKLEAEAAPQLEPVPTPKAAEAPARAEERPSSPPSEQPGGQLPGLPEPKAPPTPESSLPMALPKPG